MDHELLTVKEVQRLLQVSRCIIEDMIDSGKLRAVKIGSQYKIEARSVKNFLSETNQVSDFDNENLFVNISNYESTMISEWT